MSDADFSPVEPFGIDANELDGLSHQECFTLGVEWQMVSAEADGDDGFERPVHAANKERLATLLTRRGRQFRMMHMHDDISESWLWLTVEPK